MLDYDEIIRTKEVFSTSGKESIIYMDSSYLYKIFSSKSKQTLDNKFHKVNLFSSLRNFDEYVVPLDNVMDKKSIFRGYSMTKIDGITLADVLNIKGIIPFILGLIDSSVKLSSIHARPEKIILGDINTGNILLRSNCLSTVFLDIDGASIDGLKCECISTMLKAFISPRLKNIKLSQNSDRLVQLLCLLLILFKEVSLYNIDIYDFDKKCEQISSLYNMRKLLQTLQDTSKKNPQIPYLHEMIDAKEIKKYTK